MSPYSERNIDKMDDITGRFNSVLENVILAVCNELKSDKSHKSVNTNALKSVITEKEVRVEREYKDKIAVENVANFIFLSNNFRPFRQDVDDRRNLDIQCVKPDEPDTYFKALGAEVDASEFLPTLFTYLNQYDVPVDYDFIHTLPMTSLKQVIQQTYKTPFEQFITEHHEQFVEGWESKECRRVAEREIIAKMNERDRDNGERVRKGLTLDLQKYCGGSKQVRRGNTKVYVYKLLSNYIEAFKPTQEQLANGEVEGYLDGDMDCV
jgi:hypothetical protein